MNNKISTVTVYTSENPLRNPLKLLWDMFECLYSSRELAFRLTTRDISAKYRQSLLGYFWAFIPPIATGLIFIFLNKAGVINVNVPTNVPYPVYVFSGTILWLLFTDSINAPLRVVQSNKSMLSKINFPREALLVAGFLQVLFDYAIRLTILASIMIIFKTTFNPIFLVFPIASLALCLLGYVLGIMLIPLGILYSDIASALPTFTQLWFFVTPVVYTIPNSGLLSMLFRFNPVTPILCGVREIITNGFILNPIPFFLITFISLIGLLFVWVVYRVSLPILIERM